MGLRDARKVSDFLWPIPPGRRPPTARPFAP